MTTGIQIDPDSCTGCLNCMAVCMQHRSGCADRDAAAIRVILDPFTGDHHFQICRQCADAACSAACPQDAIRFNAGTGAWVIHREDCIRCGACVTACPFHGIYWSAAMGPVKCDLCGGRMRCVEACHFGVLSGPKSPPPSDGD